MGQEPLTRPCVLVLIMVFQELELAQTSDNAHDCFIRPCFRTWHWYKVSTSSHYVKKPGIPLFDSHTKGLNNATPVSHPLNSSSHDSNLLKVMAVPKTCIFPPRAPIVKTAQPFQPPSINNQPTNHRQRTNSFLAIALCLSGLTAGFTNLPPLTLLNSLSPELYSLPHPHLLSQQ